MGIHNESGYQRLRPIPPLTQLIDQMMGILTSTTDEDRSFLPFKHDGNDRVVLLVNNLGGISELEMGAVAGKGSFISSFVTGPTPIDRCIFSVRVATISQNIPG